MPARALRIAATAEAVSRPSLWHRFIVALSLRRQRKALARLDDRLLDDVGLDRDAALAEAARPVWDVPRHWQR